MSQQSTLEKSVIEKQPLSLNWMTEFHSLKQSPVTKLQRSTVEILVDSKVDFPAKSKCEIELSPGDTVVFQATKVWTKPTDDGKKIVGMTYEATPLDAFQIYCYLNETP